VEKQWAGALLSVKSAVLCKNDRAHNFELASLNKKKKEKHFGLQVTFWFGMFAMLFWATGRVVYYESTQG